MRLETRSAEEPRWLQVISQMEATFHAIIRRFSDFNIVVLIFLKFGLSSSVFFKRFFSRLVWFSIPINICCKISLVQLYVPALGIAKD